jgi:xanthine dehydrogenase YagT iron-sulfur-binding subunit
MPSPTPGDLAPDFLFHDGMQQRRLSTLRGTPVIVAVRRCEPPAPQPVLQVLHLGAERVQVLASTDEAIALHFGITSEWALFVIGATGRVIWSWLDTESTVSEALRVPELSRRDFVATVFAASLAAAFAGTPSISEAGPTNVGLLRVACVVNGTSTVLRLQSGVTLLDALREQLQLTGTKKGCDHGQCGACTVHIQGRRVLACLTLAATVQDKSITTIEGLAHGEELHPMQQAFIDHDGFQCGYCTAGQIMSAVALLHEPCGSADDDVRELMSGNICRCGAYPGILAAVQSQRGPRS